MYAEKQKVVIKYLWNQFPAYHYTTKIISSVDNCSPIYVTTTIVFHFRATGARVTTTSTNTNNLGLVITGLTEADVGSYTCTATYSNSEYLAQSVYLDSFGKYCYRFDAFSNIYLYR